ncbi:unnamed protein product [Ectocarpus sp. 12 AP-2014]
MYAHPVVEIYIYKPLETGGFLRQSISFPVSRCPLPCRHSLLSLRRDLSKFESLGEGWYLAWPKRKTYLRTEALAAFLPGKPSLSSVRPLKVLVLQCCCSSLQVIREHLLKVKTLPIGVSALFSKKQELKNYGLAENPDVFVCMWKHRPDFSYVEA